MEDARLPIEVCERVMDCARWPDDADWVEMNNCSERALFLACARVCSAWLPRALVNLYHTVTLGDSSDVNGLIRTIVRRPDLADLIQIMFVQGNVDVTYVPFAHGFLTSHLRNLRNLQLDYVTLMKPSKFYPPRYHLLVAQYPIQELALQCYWMDADQWLWALKLIWALRSLRRLHLSGHYRKMDASSRVSPVQMQRAKAACRPDACAQLRSLTISVSNQTSLDSKMCVQ